MSAQANGHGAQHGIDMDAVHTAAASPDPRVRSAARRRLEIAKEIEPLDTFLSFYAAEATTTPTPVAITSTKSKAAAPAKPVNGTPSKTSRMVDAALAIIAAHGRPMPLGDLYRAIGERSPDLASPNANSMRARLREQRDRISNTDGSGYWPTGRAAPGKEPPTADV